MRLSQNSIPRTKSYATNPGLPSTDRTKKRGSSFAKLPTNIQWFYIFIYEYKGIMR